LYTLFTLAIACIKVCPLIGLSKYIVCRHGTSKPVSHISHTMTSFSSSSGDFIRSARALRCSFVVWCLAISGPSADEAVITTFIAPLERSSLCHWGLILVISLYKSTAIRLDIVTIMPFPSKTSCRCSKWLTISAAMCLIRSLLPINASSCVHLALAFWVSARSSRFSSLSTSAMSFFPSSLKPIFANRLS